jgi:hypothetical protein
MKNLAITACVGVALLISAFAPEQDRPLQTARQPARDEANAGGTMPVAGLAGLLSLGAAGLLRAGRRG